MSKARDKQKDRLFIVASWLVALPILIGIVIALFNFSPQESNEISSFIVLVVGPIGLIVSILAFMHTKQQQRRVVLALYALWFVYITAAALFTQSLNGLTF